MMKNNNSKFTDFVIGENNKIFLFFLLLFASICIRGQTSVTKNPRTSYDVTVDTLNSKIEIRFNSEKPISNLLVVVSDSIGNTLFLDNQYRFSGQYSHTVDLIKYGKGVYFLNITNDDERVYQKLTVK